MGNGRRKGEEERIVGRRGEGMMGRQEKKEEGELDGREGEGEKHE